MKTRSLLCCVLTFVVVLNLPILRAQEEESKGQLWLTSVLTVKPAMVAQHKSLMKEIVELCQKHSITYGWYTYHNGKSQYYRFYPVQDYGEIDNMEKTFAPIAKEWGTEKMTAFQETIDSYKDFFIRLPSELSYIPENPRLKGEEQNYAIWDMYYVSPGKGKEHTALFKEYIALLKSKDYNAELHFCTGDIGMEGPVYFGMGYGKNKIDFLEQNKKMWELVGEEGWKIFRKGMALTKKRDKEEFWYLRDLSYIPENE